MEILSIISCAPMSPHIQNFQIKLLHQSLPCSPVIVFLILQSQRHKVQDQFCAVFNKRQILSVLLSVNRGCFSIRLLYKLDKLLNEQYLETGTEQISFPYILTMWVTSLCLSHSLFKKRYKMLPCTRYFFSHQRQKQLNEVLLSRVHIILERAAWI